ncbi:uncharacterized protein LOC129796196 [Lutzomyia longipalpis]|uniref:uncharacterized protein LOC129796196 n=1 Tax=Lutzomyia longipalpis TaxID=7200 RepID=UPI0024845525|nr:uncharacterized protein LOC129796196 [Lutzomyia longipalpis]
MDRSAAKEFLQELYVRLKENMKLSAMIIAFERKISAGNFDGLTEEEISNLQYMPTDAGWVIVLFESFKFIEELEELKISCPQCPNGTKNSSDTRTKLTEMLRRQEEDLRGFMMGIAGQEYWDSFEDDEEVLLAVSRLPDHNPFLVDF